MVSEVPSRLTTKPPSIKLPTGRIPSSPTSAPVQPASQHRKSWLLPAASVLVIGMFGAAGYFYWSGQDKSPATKALEVVPAPPGGAISPPATPVAQPTPNNDSADGSPASVSGAAPSAGSSHPPADQGKPSDILKDYDSGQPDTTNTAHVDDNVVRPPSGGGSSATSGVQEGGEKGVVQKRGGKSGSRANQKTRRKQVIAKGTTPRPPKAPINRDPPKANSGFIFKYKGARKTD